MAGVKPTTAGAVMAALVKRFAPPAWALLEQVGDGTGYGVSRHADAVAMSLWPSRGLDLHGVEVKVSRGDWLRELKRPQKAEPIACYCDFWWLAVAPAVVDLAADAMPQAWGVLALEGRRLVQVRAAERNTITEPLDKSLLAAILRRASERHIPKSAIADTIAAAREDGFARGSAAAGDDGATRDLDRLRASVAAFEAASGLAIGSYNGGTVGKRFAAALALEAVREQWRLDQAASSLRAALKAVDEAAAALREADCSPEAT